MQDHRRSVELGAGIGFGQYVGFSFSRSTKTRHHQGIRASGPPSVRSDDHQTRTDQVPSRPAPRTETCEDCHPLHSHPSRRSENSEPLPRRRRKETSARAQLLKALQHADDTVGLKPRGFGSPVEWKGSGRGKGRGARPALSRGAEKPWG